MTRNSSLLLAFTARGLLGTSRKPGSTGRRAA